MSSPKYFALYKPYGMLSQFTAEGPDSITLAHLNSNVPKDVYPVGRLDKDSEGLLLLSNDGAFIHKMLEPRHGHGRTYYCQVEGIPTSESIAQLGEGVELKDGFTLPAKVWLLEEEPELPEREPPIRVRLSIPTSWIGLTLIEGRNRQVRRMTAAVGYPTLRLVRWSIGNLDLGTLKLKAGEVVELKRQPKPVKVE